MSPNKEGWQRLLSMSIGDKVVISIVKRYIRLNLLKDRSETWINNFKKFVIEKRENNKIVEEFVE